MEPLCLKEIIEMNDEELQNRLVQAEKKYEKMIAKAIIRSLPGQTSLCQKSGNNYEQTKEIYEKHCVTDEMEEFMDVCYELELIYKRLGRMEAAGRMWKERNHAVWAYSHEMHHRSREYEMAQETVKRRRKKQNERKKKMEQYRRLQEKEEISEED